MKQLIACCLFLAACAPQHPPAVAPAPLAVAMPQEQLMTSEEKKGYAIGQWCVSEPRPVEILTAKPIIPKDQQAKIVKTLTKKPQRFIAGQKCDLSGYGWLEGIGYTDEHSLGRVVVRYWQSQERAQYTDCPGNGTVTFMLDFGDFLRLCDPIKAEHQREIGTKLHAKEEKASVEQAVKEQKQETH